MITRRRMLFAACALVLPAAGIAQAQAHDLLVQDLIAGVSDALIRDYIRRHYDGGRWDGHAWWRDGRRYTVIEYRNWLIEDYWRDRRRREYGHRPPPPPPRREVHHRPPRHDPPRHEPPRREPPRAHQGPGHGPRAEDRPPDGGRGPRH